MKKEQAKFKGIFLAILGSVFWGGSGVFAQFLMQDKQVSTSWLVGTRMVIAGMLILGVLGFKHPQNVFKPLRQARDVMSLVVFSLFGVIVLQYSFFTAIHKSNAATATILQFLAPVFLVIYFSLVTKKRPNTLSLFSLGLSLVGTFLLVTGGDVTQLSMSVEGFIWGLLAGFFGAFYIVQPRRLLVKYGTTLIIGWGMLIGGVLFQFIYPMWIGYPTFDGITLLGIAFVIVFGTIFSYMCLLKSTDYIPAQFASLLTSFEPLSSALLSSLFLGVVLTKIEMLSMCIIIFSVFLLSKNEDV